jgi:hypothetical protein
MDQYNGTCAEHSYFLSKIMNSIMTAISDDSSLSSLKKLAESDSEESCAQGSSIESRNGIMLLMRAGLIEENQGRLSLSSMGTEMYKHIRFLSSACNFYPRLQYIDSMASARAMPKNELMRIIDTLIEDSNVRHILKENLDG